MGLLLSCVGACDLFSFDVFLWRSYKDTNHAFRLVDPVYDMHMNMFKVNVDT